MMYDMIQFKFNFFFRIMKKHQSASKTDGKNPKEPKNQSVHVEVGMFINFF